jgi:hypothetical protein
VTFISVFFNVCSLGGASALATFICVLFSVAPSVVRVLLSRSFVFSALTARKFHDQYATSHTTVNKTTKNNDSNNNDLTIKMQLHTLRWKAGRRSLVTNTSHDQCFFVLLSHDQCATSRTHSLQRGPRWLDIRGGGGARTHEPH